jgi:hypothetical protein
VVKYVIVDSDFSARIIGAPARKVESAAIVIKNQVVMYRDIFDGVPLLNRNCETGPSAVVNHVRENLDVFYLAEPCVEVDALSI